mmetsp:Transcript_47122/g.112159  ORF Transcript_47122/g.112159 Transcript_47122/m.112159 type:complete len:500 (-) Transcript_47122:1623-3122(-)
MPTFATWAPQTPADAAFPSRAVTRTPVTRTPAVLRERLRTRQAVGLHMRAPAQSRQQRLATRTAQRSAGTQHQEFGGPSPASRPEACLKIVVATRCDSWGRFVRTVIPHMQSCKQSLRGIERVEFPNWSRSGVQAMRGQRRTTRAPRGERRVPRPREHRDVQRVHQDFQLKCSVHSRPPPGRAVGYVCLTVWSAAWAKRALEEVASVAEIEGVWLAIDAQAADWFQFQLPAGLHWSDMLGKDALDELEVFRPELSAKAFCSALGILHRSSRRVFVPVQFCEGFQVLSVGRLQLTEVERVLRSHVSSRIPGWLEIGDLAMGALGFIEAAMQEFKVVLSLDFQSMAGDANGLRLGPRLPVVSTSARNVQDARQLLSRWGCSTPKLQHPAPMLPGERCALGTFAFMSTVAEDTCLLQDKQWNGNLFELLPMLGYHSLGSRVGDACWNIGGSHSVMFLAFWSLGHGTSSRLTHGCNFTWRLASGNSPGFQRNGASLATASSTS